MNKLYIFVFFWAALSCGAQEPVEITINPITQFRMITNDWYDGVFKYGSDLSKYANKPVQNIEIRFVKEYHDGYSMVTMEDYIPVEINHFSVLTGRKPPMDELKVFKDKKEVLDFHDLDIANEKFDVKMVISNERRRTFSEVEFSDVKIVGVVHRKKE